MFSDHGTGRSPQSRRARRPSLGVLVLAALVNANAQTRIDYDLAKRVARDDYETAGARPGTPRIVEEDIAPAVFVKTKKGIYTVPSGNRYDGVAALLPEPYGMQVPTGDGEWLQVSYVLHRFMSESGAGPTDCSARFFVAPAGEVAAGRLEPYAQDTSLSLFVTCGKGGKELDFQLCQKLGGMANRGAVLYHAACPASNLPIGIEVFLSATEYAVAFSKPITTVSGRSVGEQGFAEAVAALASPRLKSGIRLVNHEAGTRSQMVIDDFEANTVRVREVHEEVPTDRPKRRFEVTEDASWTLVWNDEFDGTRIDDTKWLLRQAGPRELGEGMPPGYVRRECVSLDGDGHARIRFGLDAEGRLESGSMRSLYTRAHGYFEARLKLTSQPGWWAAFWLNRPMPGPNPFIHGVEIDVLEDFWQKSRKDDTLQHALHTGVPSRYSKSFTRDAHMPQWDGWHVFGVDWGPLETVIYVDGVETACFDMTQGVTTMPCQILFSGCIGSKAAAFTGSYRDAELPEEFVIDYIRVYEQLHPGETAPQVQILTKSGTLTAGDHLCLEAQVSDPDGEVRTAYLFDNGYLLATVSQPPYRFDVTFSDEFLGQTAYMKRSSLRGVSSLLTEHVLVVMAQDDDGLVGHSAPVEFYLQSANQDRSRPYAGVPQAIPGRVEVELFDEGGMGVAYMDSTPGNTAPGTFRRDDDVDTPGGSIGWTSHGEWLRYTVRIAGAGRYALTVPFACGLEQDYDKGVVLDLDGKRLADIQLPGLTGDWHGMQDVTAAGVELPAGEHILTLRIRGGTINLDYVEFTAE